MNIKYLKIILILLLFYQSPLYSKSTTFEDLDTKNITKYFSGIVAFENKNNLEALNFFNSSKTLLNEHDAYLKRYVYSLVLEQKVYKAIKIVKQNNGNENSKFFDAHLLLIVESLKKNDLNQASIYLTSAFNLDNLDKFNSAILETLKQFIHVFKEKKILDNKKNFGNLSIISETFQRCYLGDPKTDSFFSNLINSNGADFTRYVYFYLSYLIENNRIPEAKIILEDVEYINSPLLLSQGKSWIEEGHTEKFKQFFSCKNHNDLIAEFLFLISNLYSSEDNFEKSNFYLNISNYLNPKFLFNLSLIAENHYLNSDYKKTKKILKNFNKEDRFYYWYRLKKEAQIIAKTRNTKESINFLKSNFEKIDLPNKKFLFDIANFHKNAEEYNKAIKYYSKIIDDLDDDSEIKSDLLYRRGASYERIGNYEKSDKDFFDSLKISPDDAYVLNYLAYSWLERDYKINEAIKMLETAYASKNNDPYIIDSIGWAYFLTNDFLKAEKLLKRAVELMPYDPIVNDHYGDILWKLNRKIQARYFWSNVLKMEDAEEDMVKKINLKMIKGL